MNSQTSRPARRGSTSSRTGQRRSNNGSRNSRPSSSSRGYSSSRSSSSRPSSSTRKPTFGGRGRSSVARGERSFDRRNKPGQQNRFANKRNSRSRKLPTFDPSQFINKNPIEIKEETYVAKHKFADFDISKKLSKRIAEMNLITPSPIQDQIIPEILNGRDVIGLAETGTGKTAAFLIPLIERTMNNPDTQTLILTPTRELAIQINDELFKLTRGLEPRLYSVTCVGSVNIRPQISALKRTNHFIIGTPGRVLDLINRGSMKTDKINAVVLDEADRMLDMGFIHDTRAILSTTAKERNTLLFSATMSKETEGLVNDFLKNPITVSVKKKDVTDSIEQDVVPFKYHHKFETLTDLLKGEEFKRVIIFGAMKHSVEKLSRELVAQNIKAESIHGNKSHPQRQRALKQFKTGGARVLVATDVAARGIHVDNITHVINYDLPSTFEDYVHRIGRTGRGSKHGKALTFVEQR